MRMDEGLDTGPILNQLEDEIRPEDDARTLGDRLARLGGMLLVGVLRTLAARRPSGATPGRAERDGCAPLLPGGTEDRLGGAGGGRRSARAGALAGSRRLHGVSRRGPARCSRPASRTTPWPAIRRPRSRASRPTTAGSSLRRAAGGVRLGRSRRPAADGCPRPTGRGEPASSPTNGSDDDPACATGDGSLGGTRGRPACRRRGRVLEPGDPGPLGAVGSRSARPRVRGGARVRNPSTTACRSITRSRLARTGRSRGSARRPGTRFGSGSTSCSSPACLRMRPWGRPSGWRAPANAGSSTPCCVGSRQRPRPLPTA